MSQESIAYQLKSQIGQVIERWTASVREDSRIQSDGNLTKPELVDHVPALIEEICELIEKHETPGLRNSLEARANVYVRFHQGYTGRDLVRELSLLRITLLDFLVEMTPEGAEAFSAKDCQESGRIINLYLDEEMRYAISVFCGSPRSS